MTDLLNSIPAKSTVDRLVSQWFNSQGPSVRMAIVPECFVRKLAERDTDIIHAPTFQEEVGV